MKNLDFILCHECFRNIGSILYNGVYFYFPDDITFRRIGMDVFNMFPADISGKYAHGMMSSTLVAWSFKIRRNV
jgi:hypothetical protein